MEEVAERLLPIFYNDKAAVRDFLSTCLRMKSTQITDVVNRLVKERVISDRSKGRDLWQVLHDYGIYDKTESNWNMRVK